ncbi:hypothetical protein DEJ46_12770 [Streptomyces venezuelae]|uniref:Uncharacterized protein n=1 Tax=Streptomyces venezuelae TaxID=54571 RepID=A0A5P2ASP0_STRVZ|nr:hypothetical protein DEJ46_12770 [Streptomyces venezuelae]
MGHRLKGVEGTYSHASPEMERAVARGLQKLWEVSAGAEDWAHRQFWVTPGYRTSHISPIGS